jgi:phosphoribosylaminoimidazole-succinocarboxamide synthase
MPARSSIFCWLQDHRDFAYEYALVKEMHILDLCDEILTTARSRVFNTEKIREKKLKLQTLFRLVTHLSAKKYRISLDGLG